LRSLSFFEGSVNAIPDLIAVLVAQAGSAVALLELLEFIEHIAHALSARIDAFFYIFECLVEVIGNGRGSRHEFFLHF
jgi:hypothetical protein